MFQYPNIFPVDLDSGSVSIVSIRHLCMGDAYANRVGAQVFQGGSRVQLYGLCLAKAILADGQTVPIQDGQMDLDESIIYVDLPAACYAVEGPIKISVVWYNGDHRTTLLVACGNVVRTETGTVIDPGTIIPSVAQLIQEIEDAVGSIPPEYSALLAAIAPTFSSSGPLYPAGSYIWYDGALYRFTLDHPAATPWTGEDVVTAEIGAGIADAKAAASAAAAAAASAVRYDTEQSLTDAQKATARDNIGAAEQTAFSALKNDTELYAFQLRRAAVIEKALVKNWVNGMLGSSTGVPTSGWDTRGIYTPDYYLVSPGMEIRFTGNTTGKGGEGLNHYAYFYNAEKNMIGSRGSKVPYTIPEDAYYVRFAYAFAVSSGQTLDGYGGIDAVVAEWNVSCVSAIEKALQGGTASLQSVQQLSSPKSIQALDADGGENE